MRPKKLKTMKTLKILIVIIGMVSLSYVGLAQDSSFKFLHAGYSRISSSSVDTDYDALDGFFVGFSKYNRLSSGNFFWGYDFELGYNVQKSTVQVEAFGNTYKVDNNASALSAKLSVDMSYKFDASEKVSILPYAGATFRPFITGESDTNGVVFSWFKNRNGKRFQAGAEAGVKVFVKRIVLGAEYQYYFTKLNKDNLTTLSLSAGWLF